MHVNNSITVETVVGSSLCDCGKVEESEYTITFSSFSVCENRNRSALVRDLLSNKSQFVGRL